MEIHLHDKIGGQWTYELDRLIEVVNQYKPRSYLEVGAREGIALRYFVERVPSIETVSAVDLPGAKWGRKDSKAELLDNFAALGMPWVFHEGNSTSPSIVEEVSKTRYDVIFIDADHTYEGVKQDWENYGPLADMLVCFHDINHPSNSPAYGPSKLWNELKTDTSIELIKHGSRKGIRVLRK